MPAKNVIKPYIAGGYYHLYNRTVPGVLLFRSDKDYRIFLSFLKKYLAPELQKDPITGLLLPNTLATKVDLLCYALMPNHFHLLVHQRETHGVTELLRRVFSSYALYYNDQYAHQGSLFAGKLRGILVDSDEYLVHLSRYIHRNALALPGIKIQNLSSYEYSSYPNFLGIRKNSWLNAAIILHFFSSHSSSLSYRSFVEFDNPESEESITAYLLE